MLGFAYNVKHSRKWTPDGRLSQRSPAAIHPCARARMGDTHRTVDASRADDDHGQPKMTEITAALMVVDAHLGQLRTHWSNLHD